MEIQSLAVYVTNNNIYKHLSITKKKLIILMQLVRTQFSKDDVESSDSSVCWIVDDDINGDDGVWVDLAAK
jgi:hypothetical protein